VRILFLSDNFPPEGNAPAARLHEHAIRWVRDGHEVTVVTCAPNFPEGEVYPGYRNCWRQVEEIDGIRVVRVKTFITANEGVLKRTLDYLSFMVAGFIGGLLERRPDVVVATTPQFFCAVGGWALATVRRLPFVLELRDLWPESISAVGAVRHGGLIRWLERIELFLYRRAARIVTVTNAFRENLVSRGIPPGKIHVVVNGVDLDRYAPVGRDAELARAWDVESNFVVGYIGTHGLAHALHHVVEAASLLAHRSDIVFLFAGGGAERRRIEGLVLERGLANVRLVPRQPKTRMPALWSLCDVALVPLRDTPVFATVLPSKLFEAMGMGVPVLMALPDGEATGIVRETGCGICTPPEDPRALAEAVALLAGDRVMMAALRQAGLQAAQGYSRDRQARLMLEVLLPLASAPASTRTAGITR
jgi:colanic acid biosynthesis glycosyl transferase WcaI